MASETNGDVRPVDDPDVLIIGAGPVGAVAAKRLAEEGIKVVCLEQGEWPDYSTSRAAHLDLEITATRDWGRDPNIRRASADYPIEDSESDIAALNWNGVGGGTVIYSAKWHRQLPSDFRVRSLDGVADDWPLTYEDLEPYYVRVERDFGVSGLAGDPAYPPGEGPPLPPLPMREMGRRLAKAHNELGWHWWPGSSAIASRPYGRLNPCTQRATCMQGCIEGAKGSADITHWPDAIKNGARLITGARVRRLETNDRGLVTGAAYVDRQGREHFQKARVTILAANGVGTPRLLLLSATGEHPDGLANSSGLVGKRLMMHPFGAVAGLFEDDLETSQGAWGQQIQSFQFYETDESRDFVRGAKWGLQPTGGPLAMTSSYPWAEAKDPIWGEHFHESLRKRLGHAPMWSIVAEDLPEESNRVVLDPDLTDGDGIPAPKISYRFSENSKRIMHFNTARAKESLEAAGAYETVVGPFVRASGWHLIGTAVMGTDPATSVVNEWGQAHDVPNLFVFDGSIWPTSSGVNPTATMAALALRCTEHLIRERSEIKTAAV